MHYTTSNPTESLQAGDRIGPYELLELIGRGGFSIVFRARRLGGHEDVALKILNASDRHDAQQHQLFERFAQEAWATAQLQHATAIKVRDYGQTNRGVPYLVTELIPGRTLEALLQESAAGLPLYQVTHLAEQVLDCLAEAHQRGIVHRDLKPGNLMLVGRPHGPDQIKLLDFGIARVTSPNSAVKTLYGYAMGTPGYMAPEMLTSSRDVDGRADLYALGLILAEAVSGRPVVASISDHLRPGPHALDAKVHASPLFPVIERACRKARGERFEDAWSMREALGAVTARLAERTVQRRAIAGAPRPPQPQTIIPASVARPPDARRVRRTTSLGRLSAFLLALVVVLGGSLGLLTIDRPSHAGPPPAWPSVASARADLTSAITIAGDGIGAALDDAAQGATRAPQLLTLAQSGMFSAGSVMDRARTVAESRASNAVVNAPELVFTLRGEPHHAVVRVGGRRVCSALPCRVVLPTDEDAIRVRVSAEGFESRALWLERGDDTSVRVRLERDFQIDPLPS